MSETTEMKNKIIQKNTTESDHDHYMRIVGLGSECRVELQRKRCITCEKFDRGVCQKHNTTVPEDYIFAVNDCQFYEVDLPF